MILTKSSSAEIGLGILLVLLVSSPVASSQQLDSNYLGTYSIIARDPQTGQLGEAVQSKAFAGGNRAMTARGGLAIIAHQAAANPLYGVLGLQLLSRGLSPEKALEAMLRSDQTRDRQQVSILDIQGRSAAWTGKGARDWKGHKCGADYCAQGNILVGPEVLEALARSFESSSGPLAERLVDALDAAQAAGGDARGMQSAALLVVKPIATTDDFDDRAVDLRVDDSRTPLKELRRLLNLQRSDEMIRQGRLSLDQGRPPEALERALAARDKSPDNDNAWIFLARMHLWLNQKEQALKAIRQAVELNPANARQLLLNHEFESVHSDPVFLQIVADR
ncbi:MAG: DUF1028 domain-containing protein [Candidatus Tectomicrobia bacterium]